MLKGFFIILFLNVNIFVQQKEANNSAKLIKKILFTKLYKNNELNDQAFINQDYTIKFLTNSFHKDDLLYVHSIKKNFGERLKINKYFTLLNLTVSNDKKTKTNLIDYLSTLYTNPNLSNIFYTNFSFKEIGTFYFCVLSPSTNYCINQGDEQFISFNINNKSELNIIFIIIVTLIALFLSALFSGLTLGILSLDKHELQVLINAGDKEEKKNASAILPLRKKGNFLLCTLVIGNTVADSLLTFMVGFLFQGPLIVMISSGIYFFIFLIDNCSNIFSTLLLVLIVIFGQLLPLAISTRYGLSLGAKTIYITYFFIFITYPISVIASYVLDCILGEESATVYDKERLMEYIRITRPVNKLKKEQLNMISGVLFMRDKTVDQVMTKLDDVFMLPIDTILTEDTIKKIFRKGYSRIPVYTNGKRHQIVSILFLKDLVLLNFFTDMTVENLILKTKHLVVVTYEKEKIYQVLEYMKKGKSHMLLVKKSKDEDSFITGIITMEDVIEEVLQTEINDEADLLKETNNENNLKNVNCSLR